MTRAWSIWTDTVSRAFEAPELARAGAHGPARSPIVANKAKRIGTETFKDVMTERVQLSPDW
jgi:hypothetical protein